MEHCIENLNINIDLPPFKEAFSALKRLKLVTKRLKFQLIKKGEAQKKLVISTQVLSQMNYNKGDRLIEEVIGEGQGLRIRKASMGEKNDKIVYERSYTKSKRKETLLDIRNQSKIAMAFNGAMEAHIKITPEEILVTPVFPLAKTSKQGASIKIPSLSENRDAIISALDTLRANKITSALIEYPDSSFAGTQDCLLLKTQLRRDGFNINESSSSMRVYLQGHESLPTPYLPLVQPNKSTVPPDISLNFDTFVGMSGGVDGHCLEAEGFNVTSGLEMRPNEKRDKTDKTELYALSLALNTSMTSLFNENIYDANMSEIGKLTSGIMHANYSLSCTDFSSLKTIAARNSAIEELSTTRDMFIPLLSLIAHQQPITLSVENVPAFLKSDECDIFIARLERLGYKVTTRVLSSPRFGGLTTRTRLMMFATLLDAPFFEPEESTAKQTAWAALMEVGMEGARDVTETKSVKLGKEVGRLRPMKEGATLSPVVTRSQLKQTKDSLYLSIGDRYYLPSIAQLKTLMRIPKSFDISAFTKDIQAEIIGQSVCMALHSAWGKAIKKHITNAFSAKSFSARLSSTSSMPLVSRTQAVSQNSGHQLAFTF